MKNNRDIKSQIPRSNANQSQDIYIRIELMDIYFSDTLIRDLSRWDL